MEKPKHILPQLKSTPPKQPLSPHIYQLIGQTNLNISDQKIIELSDVIQKDLLQGFKSLVDIDKTIGGVGQHNVNKEEGDMVTGAYRVKYRPLFRPIQYIYSCLEHDNLIWEARTIVMNSCLHVEKSYKYFFGISEGNKGSLGVLLNNNPNNITLDPLLLKIINDLNKTVYGKSKHTIEHIDIDAHDFSPADSIAIYLVCRCIGVKLLKPTGIFDNWQDK